MNVLLGMVAVVTFVRTGSLAMSVYALQAMP